MMPRRPFLLYLIVFFFLMGVLVTALGLIQTIGSWNWLTAIGIFPAPVYLIFKNSFLLLSFAAAGFALWVRLSWAPAFGSFVIALTTIWFWVDRVILTQNPLPFSRHILSIISSIIIVSFFTFSLYLLAQFMKPSPASLVRSDEPVSIQGDKNE